ncbi:MAG TPA: BadF/BadG/BcrA/BcrD ATPase family protein [Thermomicrobiales bacterium]|nr:BadF/BadG/BcrA/BcrD ATPase family protein [Thermomicrobiales bacterium]
MTRDLILAIDGGQTSTKAILARRDGSFLAAGFGPACDHIHGPGGRETNRRAIHTAARDALATAGRDSSEIISAGLGLTSAAREHHAQGIFAEIVREMCDPETIWVDADYVSNLYGASAGSPGVVVIAGGGSIGYGVDDRGREAVAGGLGYLMGDDGSAWYIGLRAIVAATHANDGRGPATALLPFVCDHYRLDSVREIIRVIYADGFQRGQVSGIAPDVVRIAETDDVARQIVTDAGEKLAEIVLATVRNLYEEGDAVAVYPTGGVFAAGQRITGPFASRIADGWPTAQIRTPRFAPVVGALIQAIRALGDDITPELLDRIERTLP